MPIEDSGVDDPNQDDSSIDDIELAYLRALEASESAESLIPQQQENVTDVDVHSETSSDESQIQEPEPRQRKAGADRDLGSAETEPEFAFGDEQQKTCEDEQQRASVAQVVEGLLFVGGQPLPAKKIVDVVGGTTTHEQVDEEIEHLNRLYRTELRPYEIRLVEGGYQMAIQSDFEPVRSRVYGQGPKDVKLNQEALEILAFVAYQQPTTRGDVDALGKKNAGGILRQLLRRQLIVLNRSEDSDEETYGTTKRFLDLFGLASIDDLPQAGDFSFK